MKNFKIAMILVAVVALFSSCAKEGPSITFSEKDGIAAYDISKADFCILNLEGSVSAPAGIETLSYTRITKDDQGEVKETVTFVFDEDPAGKTEVNLNMTDTIFKTKLAKGYTVTYDVQVVDKKEQADSKNIVINIDNTATPISANWSEVIYLTRPDMTSYAQVGSVHVTESENTTIGVKMINSQTGSQAKAETTSNCTGFVVVDTDEFASAEALEEAYNAGTAVTSLMLDFDYHSKAYTVKNFIAKVDNAYVLVKYTAGDVCPTGWNGYAGNIFAFKYKKAETTPVAAK
jgi:hypothetical protein